MKVGIRTVQTPPGHRRPAGRDLYSGCGAQQSVAEKERDDSVRRRRCTFGERRARLDAQKVVIGVIERGNVQIEIGFYKAPVAGFVADESFRRKTSVGGQTEKC